MIAKKSINTPARAIFSTKINSVFMQRGITLIMVLIFMVTLSLIAAVGMRGVITGERVVANERDRAIAFQGAESAGREAIRLIATKDSSNFSARPMFPLGGNIQHWQTTSALDASSCSLTLADAGVKRYDWASDRSPAKLDCSTKTAEKLGNLSEPRYVIEFISEVTAATKDECWYRVTSRATGPSGEADVILQVMFAVEIPKSPTDDCVKDLV
jgi:type IV pilus assembly protein PilX